MLFLHRDIAELARIRRAGILFALFLCNRAFPADWCATPLAGPFPRHPATLSRILEWGSRPWELRSNPPVIFNQFNACEQSGCAAYFILDAADLRPETMRLPKTTRELAFVTALEYSLRQDAPAPWPILVFSAPDRRPMDPDFSTLATTRRIVLCNQKEPCRPAAAILLNSLYWGVSDAPPSWLDRCLAALVARHELHHARRAWVRAQKTAVLANAIEARLRQWGIFPDRNGVELMVNQSIAAREEIAAIDRSLGSTVLLPAQRMSILRYRENNCIHLAKIVKRLLDLFTNGSKPGARKELVRWLDDLFRDC